MTEIEGIWSRVQIGDKTADVYEPKQLGTRRSVVLFLHDHDLQTLSDNVAFSFHLERLGLTAICPHGQRSWWTDAVCREFDPQISPINFIRQRVIPYIFERWNVEPPRIGLMGIGMGGQGVLQLAYRFPREFPVVAAISPSVDFQNCYGQGLPLDEMFASQEAARQQTATLLILSLNWPRHQFLVCDPADDEWFESVQRLTSKLFASGIPFESDLTTTAGGHNWNYFNTLSGRVLMFLADRLDALHAETIDDK